MGQPVEPLWHEDEPAAVRNHRVKVLIRCRKCGETFRLRGSLDENGQLQTGFKRCLCDNDKHFYITRYE